MKQLKTNFSVLAATALLSLGLAHVVQAAEAHSKDGKPAEMSAMVADMTEGEIRKVDKSSKKITIKHGEIKNLDMPAMTMVFQVKDAAMLDKVQSGDKVKFKAIKTDSGIVVTDLQTSK